MIAPPKYLNRETGKLEGWDMLFLGQKGTGKTYLASSALEERTFVVVHDAKRTFREKDWIDDRWEVCERLDQCVKSKKNRICYSPSRAELQDQATQYAFFEWILQRQNTTLYIDEFTEVCEGQDIPPALRACYATGRELGIEVWIATQQPVFVPNIAFTQSRCFFVFYCALAAHRDKIKGFVPVTPDMIAALPPREFYVYQDTWRIAAGPMTYDEDEGELVPARDAA